VADKKENGFLKFFKAHKGVIIGISLGLLVGILLLTIGFFATLLIAICAGIGAFFGSNNKFKKKLFAILDKILPDIFK
jgi:uncharacterized membrane protein